MKPWLEKEEVEELTTKVRPSAQLRQLKAMGMGDLVRYRTDGSFIVMRDTMDNTKKSTKEYKLDFSGLGNGSQAA
tara:strand:+ start:116 stop:340 length:225 start_codon:yes stop_codon:yes gene_type:complete